MESEKDILGIAFCSYWKVDKKTPFYIRRDDDYLDAVEMKDFFSKELPPIEEFIIKLAKGKILDVGCGAGRHSLYFQEKQFDVTGIDISPEAIKVCKERGCEKAQVMDIFHPTLPENSFGTILLFGNGIGIGGTLSNTEKLLKILRKLIKKDGLLLLTSLDVTKTKKEVHKVYHKKQETKGEYVGSVKIRVEYKDQIGDWFQWIHIEPGKLKELCKETKWNLVSIFKEKGGEYSAVLRAI